MSEILFEPLSAPEYHGTVLCGPRAPLVSASDGVVNGVLAIAQRPRVIAESYARASVLCSPARPLVSASDEAGNRVVALVRRPQVYASSIAVEPTVNFVYGVGSLPSVVSSGHMRFRGTVAAVAAKPWVRSDDYITNGVLAVPPRPGVFSSPPIDYQGGVFIFLTPGYLYAQGTLFDLPMGVDHGVAADSADSALTIQAKEKLKGKALPTSGLTGTNTARERARAADAAVLVLWLIAEAEAVATDSAQSYLDMLLRAADTALVTGAATTQFSALLAIALYAELHDAAVPVLDASVEDTLAVLDEAAMSRIGLVLEAMSSTLAVDEAGNTFRMTVLALDEVGAADEVGASLEALAHALDGGHVLGIARAGADVYAMYAMTLSGALVSEYDLQVNSQATIGGRTYAATSEGIFLMEGDDDVGAPIVARLRKGWTSLGTLFKKQVANAYLGYTSDGQMRLKVSTTDNVNADAHSVVYMVNKVVKRTVAENRIDLAKGRHSVYWDFEIGNVLGADFDLDVIKVWRLVLNRRK